MALQDSMKKFKSEMSEAASRNLAHSRPGSTAPARLSTPQPGSKRPHESSQTMPPVRQSVHVGSELMSQVIHAVDWLKARFPKTASFEDLMGFLSMPQDLQKHKNHMKIALQDHHRVTYVPKNASSTGKETFQYNPIHPVASSDELLTYMATRQTFAGLAAKELKDVWEDSTSELDDLEKAHRVLITRNKKDNTPRMVWPDYPDLHAEQDYDFINFWSKTKLPASEVEIRTELEKAGLTPTSMVKELRKVEAKKKEKRRINRTSGKTTNLHMMGILKDYSKK